MCRALLAVVLGGLACLTACKATIPKEALRLDEQSMERRQMQTRSFDTSDELKILSACAGLVQDLGFSIDEGESELGLIVASKQRSAVETGQVVGSVLLAILTGAPAPYDKSQTMRASIVTRPLGGSIAVRVTFQRIVWNTEGKISRKEGLFDAELYQEFFNKLSKAVFLEASEI